MKFEDRTARVEAFRPEPGRRLLVVSDIHGNLPYLQGVLERAHFSESDYLIIDGDFLEKGPDSLGTLRYVMALCRKDNVRAVLGNCDDWDLFFQMTPEQDKRLQTEYLKRFKRGLLRDMFAECGLPDPEFCENLAALKPVLRERYAREWAFLASLPHALENDRFVFVHSGYNPAVPLRENSAEDFQHTDELLNTGRHFDRWVVAGHWPVVLYRDKVVCANPLIDREKKVVSIDGGCVLKDDGQLNCLIIPDINSEEFGFVSYDHFPQRRVLTGQAAGADSCYIRWGDSRVQVLARGPEFSRCRHVRTGYELDILTSYLFTGEEFTDCNDCTDYVLPLKAGDLVSVVETTSRGYFVKHNGVSGWYFGELE